jgi:hypothetical protein
MGVPAVMTDAQGKRIPGSSRTPTSWRTRLAREGRDAAASIAQPEFCAACHKANLPNPLNGYKWIRAFTAYDEWQNSKFSQRNPLTFYTGRLHHLPGLPHEAREPPTPKKPGAKNGTFASHRWEAGNTAVPFYYGFDEQLEKTIAFLRRQLPQRRYLRPQDRRSNNNMIAPLGTKFLHAQAQRCCRDARRHPEQEHRPLAHPRGSRPLRRRGSSSPSKDKQRAKTSTTAASSSRWNARRACPQLHQPARQYRRPVSSTTTRSGRFTPWPTTTPLQLAARVLVRYEFQFPHTSEVP